MTASTASWTTGSLIASGAVSGAVGSLAGQAVGVAIGAQDSINWKGVALGAVSAGVTAGLGAAGLMPNADNAFVRGALGGAVRSTVTQGIAVATGLQRSFDWKGVAASALGGGVAQGLNDAMGYHPMGGQFELGKSLVSGVGGSIVGNAARGGKLSATSIAADAFANVIGDSLAAANSSEGTYVSQEERLRDQFWEQSLGAMAARGAAPVQSYGFSMEAEQRLQTGQTVSDAYGPVNSFDATADRLRLDMLNPSDRTPAGGGLRGMSNEELAARAGALLGDSASVGARGSGIAGRGELSSSAMYAAGYGDVRETVVPSTNGGDYSYIDGNGVITVVGQRMTAAEAAAFDAASGLGPAAPAPMPIGSITPIGPVEGFFTFNPAGRFAKGAAGAAYDAWTALPRGLMGTARAVQDALGAVTYAAGNAITGSNIAYQPVSAIGQSIQSQGVLGTVGSSVIGAVRNAPGIGLIGSLYAPNRDWGNVGAQSFNIAAAGASAAVSLRGASVIDLSSGETFAPGFYRADPRQLRFTQSDASPNFVDRTTGKPIGTIDSLVADLRAGRVNADQVGSPLQIVMRDGVPYSIDNRRLVAFNAAGVSDVPIQIMDINAPGVARQFYGRFDPIRGEGTQIVIVPASGRTAAQQLLYERGLIQGVQLKGN